jgi:hypothetical protein
MRRRRRRQRRRSAGRARAGRGLTRMRAALLPVAAAVMMSRNCGHGGQQIRLPEGHRDDQSGTQEETCGACAPHVAQGAQRCRDRGDGGGLVRVHGPHQERERRAQQVSATPKRVVSIVIGRSAPRSPLALEVPPTLLARAGEVIELELSCAVRESGARAPWTGGLVSLTRRCRDRLRLLAFFE